MSDVLETTIRSICIIIGLFFIMKILGKKQLSKLSFFEYIAGITIGDIAGTMSMDEELSLTNGITSIIVWSLVPIVISSLQLRFKKFRDFVEGTPTTFIEDGKIIEKAMRKEKYSADELLEQLRKNDVFRVADVEFAELDSNGDLSLILKQGKQPVTLEDLNIERRQILQPHAVISDGKIDDNALRKTGYTKEWIVQELNKKNVTIDQVFIAQLDRDGNFTYDLLDQYDTK